MKKRGLSIIITTLIVIFLALAMITIIWVVLSNILKEQSEIAQIKNTLMFQNLDIKRVYGNLTNPSDLNITIKGGGGKVVFKNSTLTKKYSDIVFVVDSTGSMKEEITTVKNTILGFVGKLEEKSIDYRLALVDFKDYDTFPCGSISYSEYPSQVHLFQGEEFMSNSTEYQNELQGIIDSIENSAIGGDIPESHLIAMSDSINLGFRENAKKFIIVLSDAPPHAKDCTYPKSILDIVLVTDHSGSMIQSGWSLETSLTPSIEFKDVTVPLDDYGPSNSFNIPAGTQRMAVTINWSRIPGVIGSEGSEFALNLRRPSGEWIFGGNAPAVSGKVDPPDNVGADNEYFSGVDTKPQAVYIENPMEGNWEVKVFANKLRPVNDPDVPRPLSQNVDISVYNGSISEINKSETIISLEAAKSSAISFVDNLKDDDRAAYVKFGTSAELLQNLTFDKDALKTAIDNSGLSGVTAIHLGIENATNELANARPEATKVIILLTDGQNDDGPAVVEQAANDAKAQGITIFTIGLTGFVNHEMLRNVATKPEYYFYSPDASDLEDIYEQISQTLGSEFSSSVENTYESCYTGPEYVSDIKDQLKENDVTFYYLNKQEGLCNNEVMKDTALSSGGRFYEYTEAQGLNDLVLGLTDVLTETYEGVDNVDKLKIVFYNDTESWIMNVEPPLPLQVKNYEILGVGNHIININRIEIYLVTSTESGKEVVSHLMDFWEV